MKKILISALLVIIFIGIFTLYTVYTENKLINKITLEKMDITSLKDGTYIGQYNTKIIDVEVSVTIKTSLITDITILKHHNGKGAKAEIILESVVDKNSLEVDIISGATASSKVILKAIEQALLEARRESL